MATAAARATEYAAPETSRGYYAVAGSIFVARVADVSDPLEVVAESEWAMRGTDSIAAEDARGEVISAAADAVAERFVAAVAALPPPASDAAKESTGRRDAIAAEARRLVACAASTGETGADAARDAAYRAADAAWALRCRDEHATRAAAHAAAPDSRDAASSLADRRRRVGVRGGAVERRRVAPRKRPRALSRELRRHRVALEGTRRRHGGARAARRRRRRSRAPRETRR